jgi:hypothetical protein
MNQNTPNPPTAAQAFALIDQALQPGTIQRLTRADMLNIEVCMQVLAPVIKAHVEAQAVEAPTAEPTVKT